MNPLNLIINILVFLAIFNNTLRHVFGLGSLSFLHILVMALTTAIVIITQPLVTKRHVNLLLLYLFYLLCVTEIHALSMKYSPQIGLLAVGSYMIIPFFWLTYFSINLDKVILMKYFMKAWLWMCIVIAISTILQAHVSYNLFGLISHPNYTNINKLSNLTKRAISFISSPQGNAIFLVMSCVVFFHLGLRESKIKFYFFSCLLLYATMLTGSKSVVAFIVVYSFAQNFLSLKVKNTATVILIGLIGTLTFFTFQVDFVQRMFTIFTIINKIENYSAYQDWISYLEYQDVASFFVGHQIALTDRAVGSFLGLSNLPGNGSAESYLLKIFYEIGFVGIVLFMVMYTKSALNLYFHKNYKWLGSVLMGFFTNMLFTPSFAGSIISFFVWPIIAFGLVVQHNDSKILLVSTLK